MKRHDVLILGGGAGGITVAARLQRADRDLDVAIVEPSRDHWYQPLWTLVGGGVVTAEATRRDEASLIPKGVTWIQEAATTIDPDAKTVTLQDGTQIGYDQLVVAVGIAYDWDKVAGLRDAVGKNGVVSNYLPHLAETTWQELQAFEGGKMVFTNPSGQIKCGGAPQKIMYLAEHYTRKRGIRDDTEIIGAFAGTVMLGVPEINATLNDIVEKRDIHMHFHRDLVAVDGDAKTATFAVTGDLDAPHVTMDYDFMHVTPPMRAPDLIAGSGLEKADGPHAGFVDVDPHTLRHARYPDVWAIGDVGAIPTAKTGAAVRKQAPVLVDHLLAHRAGTSSDKVYDGYSSCPLVTGYGSLVLAEFLYDNTYKPTFPIDQTKERWDMYMLKRHLLPPMYWQGMLRGLA